MEIRRVPASEINPASYNPRLDLRPGDAEYEKIRRSIETFGLVEPLVWNERTGNLVGGHQRRKVLLAQGVTEFDVVVVNLDDEQERTLNLALNKVGGDFDDKRLAQLLQTMDQGSTELAGFDDDEVAALLAMIDDDLDLQDEDDIDTQALYDAIVEPETEPGQIIRLGRHRLMCGDATVGPEAEQLLAGARVDLVITDPPYNLDYESRLGLTIENDHLEKGEFYELLLGAFVNLRNAARPGAPIYVFHNDSEVSTAFRLALVEAGWLHKQTLIWVKNAFGRTWQDYRWGHEPILYGWKPGTKHTWLGGRDKSTVYADNVNINKLSKKELVELVKQLRSELDTTALYEDRPPKGELHPTMKPVNLVARMMKNSSKRGALVADFFGGSGSTLIAAEQTGRTAYLLELDPRYCDVIVKRWEKYTGEKAVRE